MPDCLRFEFLRRRDVAPCGRCGPCLAGPAPEPAPVPEAVVESEAEEKARLIVSLKARGAKVDGRTRLKRLRELDATTPSSEED